MTPESLAARRAKLGLSMAALARALGVNVSTVSRWERGLVPPPGMLDKALCQIEQHPPVTKQRVRRERWFPPGFNDE